MKKAPGIFALLATAVVGFGRHLASLCTSAQQRLVGRQGGSRRPRGR
jgi:uncharacterized membrane protein YedE/YeeE